MNASTSEPLSRTGTPSASTFDKPSATFAADFAAARRRLMLEGPIVGTILRLAAPTIVGSLAQMLALMIQMYFIGMLGIEAFAGVTLVFPWLTLMQLLSNGGVGAGVASAVARSLGAGRKADAEALILNAVVLGAVMGIVFSAVGLLLGETIYRCMGGTGDALVAALTYSRWVFGSALFVCVFNLLANAYVGSGNTLVPQVFALVQLATLPLAAALMFGWGPIPRLGIAGASVAFACYSFLATLALSTYARSNRTTLRLPLDIRLVSGRLMREILQVGVPSTVSVVIPTFSLMLVTTVVARFGVGAVAGFGIAMRVDYLLVPLYFSVCAGVLPMVGTNFGAAQIHRARRIAWIGAFIAAGIGAMAGVPLVVAPQLWMNFFTKDANVLAVGGLYFHVLAALYPITAFGIVLGAAAQGAGRPLWPLVAVIFRVITGAGGGWFIVVGLGYSLTALFAMGAVAATIYFAILVAGHLSGRAIPDIFPGSSGGGKH
jgi:putative MATE family efflux protein